MCTRIYFGHRLQGSPGGQILEWVWVQHEFWTKLVIFLIIFSDFDPICKNISLFLDNNVISTQMWKAVNWNLLFLHWCWWEQNLSILYMHVSVTWPYIWLVNFFHFKITNAYFAFYTHRWVMMKQKKGWWFFSETNKVLHRKKEYMWCHNDKYLHISCKILVTLKLRELIHKRKRW